MVCINDLAACFVQSDLGLHHLQKLLKVALARKELNKQKEESYRKHCGNISVIIMVFATIVEDSATMSSIPYFDNQLTTEYRNKLD